MTVKSPLLRIACTPCLGRVARTRSRLGDVRRIVSTREYQRIATCVSSPSRHVERAALFLHRSSRLIDPTSLEQIRNARVWQSVEPRATCPSFGWKTGNLKVFEAKRREKYSGLGGVCELKSASWLHSLRCTRSDSGESYRRKVKFRPHCFHECLHTTALFPKSTLSRPQWTVYPVRRTQSVREEEGAARPEKATKYSPGINRFYPVASPPRDRVLQNLIRRVSPRRIDGQSLSTLESRHEVSGAAERSTTDRPPFPRRKKVAFRSVVGSRRRAFPQDKTCPRGSCLAQDRR